MDIYLEQGTPPQKIIGWVNKRFICLYENL
jgi:hypothetical protein